MNRSQIKHRITASFMLAVICLSQATVAGAVALEVTDDSVVTNQDKTVTSSETLEALKGVDGVLEASDATQVKTDADSAMQVVTASADIDVPRDLSEGVTLNDMVITLPNAEAANDSVTVAPGTVAYPAANGSSNAVQATESGALRMLTVIDNPLAPTAYTYDVALPAGGHIVLNEDGSASVLDASGNITTSVGVPWAKDANASAVKTYFTTDGSSLTQHIEHRVPGVVYPVTADPIWFAVSAAVFWWAVARCGAGGSIGAVFEYVGGSRSWRAIAAAGAAGCIASFIGGWGILKQMVRIVRW